MSIYIGESFIGEDGAGNYNAAHINSLFGHKSSSVGQALLSAMAAPRQGYIPFMAIHQPGIPVKPDTLFAAKAEIGSEMHGNATWGAAQAGLAKGIQDLVEEGVINDDMFENWCIVACVWVNPKVNDLDMVYKNNRQCINTAIKNSLSGKPSKEDVANAQANAYNPFYTPAK